MEGQRLLFMSWLPPFVIYGWTVLTTVLLRMEEVIGGLVKRMAITDPGAVEVILPEQFEQSREKCFYLVGELMTTKPFRREALVAMVRSLWIPAADQSNRSLMTISDLDGGKRFLFSFKRASDLKWVVGGTPWSFEKALLAVAVTDGKEDPLAVSLHKQLFWIRVRGLPPIYLEDGRVESTGKFIGDALGEHVRSMRGRGSGGVLGNYLRMRVGIDITKPMQAGINFRPAGDIVSRYYELEYEHLPFFCLFCGLLDHTGGGCPKRMAGEISEPMYSALLKAERKETWLQARHKVDREPETVSGTGGWRFGLHPRKQKG